MRGPTAAKLRAQGQALQPTAFVGKAGVTASVREEVRAQLASRALVKVRFAPSVDDRQQREALARELASACAAQLVEVRGRTALLARGPGAKPG